MLTRKIQKMRQWKTNNLVRVRYPLKKFANNQVVVEDKLALNFCSNDYLGLSGHPKIIEAYIKGVRKYGIGSGASALVSGYYDSHAQFEYEFADWLGVENAILFGSGYLANIGTITALGNRKSIVLSDKLCHASLLDGIQLSRAKHFRFKHNSMNDLFQLMKSKNPDLIICESVFSIEGSIAPISEIISIVNQGAAIIVDDAHGIGVLGKSGKGISEHQKLKSDQLDCIVAPLGKAFNAMGAVVAGKKEIIESILQFARTYRYTTALPPAIACALLETLKIINDETWRRESLLGLIGFFVRESESRGLILSSQDMTPIKSIVVGDSDKAIEIQKEVLKQGFFVSCIRPPTVPKNSACIRISLNSLHGEEDIIRLLNCMKDVLVCNH